MSPEFLAIIMFFFALGLIFSGYPVAFSLGGTGVLFGLLGIALGDFRPAMLQLIASRTYYGVMENQVLLAVPFFIFMGTILEKSGLAEDLLKTVGQLFGPVPGGIGLAVVFVGALLGAATGVVGASVVAMGMISLPIMLRYNYDKGLATGVIAASGTLGQIIPPSVVLIVLATQIDNLSVGDLFKGALTPGLLLAALIALYMVSMTLFRPHKVPAIPASEREMDLKALLLRTLMVLIPPVILILIVLGSIFIGIATPTEAGALGACGAMLLAQLSRGLKFNTLRSTSRVTLRLTSMVMFLLIGSTAFVTVFKLYHGDQFIKELLLNLPGGVVGALIITNLLIFILGFFIDFFEISFIVVPLVAPVFIHDFGMPAPWFGVMVAMNLQMSFLTPPFGFSLFYLKGTCPPEVKTTDIYRGVIPFIAIQAAMLLVVILWPDLVMWMVK